MRHGPAAEPALAALAHSQASVLREAVGVLGWLKHSAALPELARLVVEDPSSELRRAATGALGLSRTDIEAQRVPAEHTLLRKEAAIALGEIGHPSAAAFLDAAAQDADPEVRKLARLARERLGAG